MTTKKQKENQVILTVVPDIIKGYGYNIKHNQNPGFKGIKGQTFGWYRLRTEAENRAASLQIEWNKSIS